MGSDDGRWGTNSSKDTHHEEKGVREIEIRIGKIKIITIRQNPTPIPSQRIPLRDPAMTTDLRKLFGLGAAKRLYGRA
jgi:hypothetical protein